VRFDNHVSYFLNIVDVEWKINCRSVFGWPVVHHSKGRCRARLPRFIFVKIVFPRLDIKPNRLAKSDTGSAIIA